MKKSLLFVVCMGFACSTAAFAEDPPAAVPETAAVTAPETPAPAEPAAPAALEAVPAAVPETIVAAPEPAAAQEATLADNLEFISGEISELDEASKSVSVRLYGENETTASDKVLKVAVDENTDITDGEQDRDLKSLSAGTEVDVEYDPATNKATYIFVY